MIYRKLDVVAYSIPYFDLLKNIKPCGNTNRFVIILTDAYNGHSLEEILSIIPKNVTQVTFKVLHDSNGINNVVDDYISKHSIDSNDLDKLRRDILNYNGNLSIRLDETCMDAKDRYKIFREDGNLYDDWEQEKVWKK